MRVSKVFVALAVLAAAAFQLYAQKTPVPADLILLNGRIWTGSPDKPFVAAAAIVGNKVIATGSENDVRRHIGTAKKTIDLGGKFAIPGINDSHVHFLGASLLALQVDLTDAGSAEEAVQLIKKFADANPEAKWITGSGWQYTIFPGGLPTRQMIDAVVDDRPVFIRAYDGHTGWANSKALEAAGVDGKTEFSGFGEIVKGARGEPTGVFKEGAMRLVASKVPSASRETQMAALREGLRRAAALGITSIQNAGGGLRELELYDELFRNGELTLRVKTAFSVGNNATTSTIEDVAAASRRFSSPMLNVGAVKLMVDGVIESHTAVMLKPYSDKAVNGTPNFTQEKLNEIAAMADKAGLQVYIHAIGDGGVRMALDAYENMLKANGRRDHRARVEHIETIDTADIARFKKLGVIASMEPIHAYPATIQVWSDAAGPERTSRGFAWKALENAGATLIFSSDYPAAISMSPWRGLHNAVNRQSIDGTPPGGWLPQHRVSVETALRAYTVNGAYASFEEKIKGRIAPGMFADLIVLDRDPFKIPPSDLHKINVLTTIFDGKVIYEKKK